MAHCDKLINKSLTYEYKKLCAPWKYNDQEEETEKWAKVLNLKNKPSCGLKEIKMIEECIRDYQILVISADADYEFIYAGPE